MLKFWDLATAQCIRSVPEDTEGNRTKAVVIGSEGKLIATGSGDGSIYLWHYDPVKNKLQRQKIEGFTSRAWTIALSKDEQYVASGDEEGTTLLISTKTGKVVEKSQWIVLTNG